jgi:hypothetical protein
MNGTSGAEAGIPEFLLSNFCLQKPKVVFLVHYICELIHFEALNTIQYTWIAIKTNFSYSEAAMQWGE